MQIRTIFIRAFVVVLIMSTICLAQYSARESFEYSPGVNAYITNVGSANNGWAGSWTLQSGTNDSLMFVDDSGLMYDDLNYEIPNVGNHLTGIKAAGEFSRYYRQLAEVWPDEAGKIYWISFLLDIKNASETTCWIGIKLGPDPPDAELPIMFGKGWGMDVFTIGSGAHDGPGEETSTISWESSPVWLVSKIVMSGDNQNERAYLWVSPDPSVEPDTNFADAKANPGLSDGFRYVKMEFGGSPDGLEVNFDEIRLGETFAGVSIPVNVRREDIQPNTYSLSQNFPNPFNPITNIRYAIPEAGLVTIKIYNLIGQEVNELLNEYHIAGTYIVDFNAINLPSGIYYYKIISGKFSETKKMVLIK